MDDQRIDRTRRQRVTITDWMTGLLVLLTLLCGLVFGVLYINRGSSEWALRQLEARERELSSSALGPKGPQAHELYDVRQEINAKRRKLGKEEIKFPVY
jgi:hypothetical protein